MEETEILPDMSVNFKDFAVETRFVVAICFTRSACIHIRYLFCVSAMTSHSSSEKIYIYSNLTPASLKTVLNRDCRHCTKLAGNGSDHCNQQFDLMSLNNISMVIG